MTTEEQQQKNQEGEKAAQAAPPPLWSAPTQAFAGSAYATPAPNPPTKSTPPSTNSYGTWSALSPHGTHNKQQPVRALPAIHLTPQTKLPASSTLPLPLYFAIWG